MKMANETTMPMSSSYNEGWLTSIRYTSITAVLAILFISWVVRVVQWRLMSKRLAESGVPSPPFSLKMGTLAGFAEIYKNAPPNIHPHAIMTLMYRKYNLKDMFFLDNWPFDGFRQIIIADPDLAAQCTQIHSLPKASITKEFVVHIAGEKSMLFSEGEVWKKHRSLFNPGFALSHLITLVPVIVDESAIFRNVLAKYADSGEVHPIEESAATLTIDIMGHVVLDIALNSQTMENEFVKSFRAGISWTKKIIGTNPFSNLNPLRPIMQRYYAQKMHNYLDKVLDNRFVKKGGQTTSNKRKPVIDIALDEYIIQQEKENVTSSKRGLDRNFKDVAIDQMRTFLFAGHDTSSSTIAFAYYLFGLNPVCLAKARDELDQVFGKDTSKIEDMLKENPNLLNKLPYLFACIKETLRIFPPADTARDGDDLMLNYKGKQFPTKGCMVMVSNHTLHHREDLFPRPEEFIPERFMPAPHNFQDIPKDAWRPFEKGPRACIGVELALLEMKIILAMTLREYDICADYETWDRKLGREKPGETLDGRRGLWGERTFQELVASAKPVDGMPVRIKRRTNA